MDHGRVVAVGQFAIGNRGLKLQHVHAAMWQDDGQFHILAQWHLKLHRWPTVDGNGQIGQTTQFRGGALILDPQGQFDLFIQNRKGGRIAHNQPPVPIVRMPGQQGMQRGGQAGGAFDIVDAPVGDQHDPGDPALRFLGQCLGQSGHQQRPAIATVIAHPDHPQFGIRAGVHLGLQSGQGGGGLIGPVRNPLAGAFIDHGHDDIGQRLAVLGLQRRVGNGSQQCRPRQPAQPPARQPAPNRQRKAQSGQSGQHPQHQPWDQRIKDQLLGHLQTLHFRSCKNTAAGGTRPKWKISKSVIIAPACPAAQAHGPDPIYNFRSAHA